MKWMTLVGVSLGMAVMSGCAANRSANQRNGAIETNRQVTDVGEPPMPTVAPQPTPVPPKPPTSTPSEIVTPSPSTSNGQTYTIRKGDTLYSIAKAHYGNGKAVNKIIAANPGISPTHLKIGQVITLP